MEDQAAKCSKCSGEMREGWLFIQVGGSSGPFGPSSVGGCGPFWAEYTGRTTGRLLKRQETNAYPIRGLRCLNCAYIELHAKISETP